MYKNWKKKSRSRFFKLRPARASLTEAQRQDKNPRLQKRKRIGPNFAGLHRQQWRHYMDEMFSNRTNKQNKTNHSFRPNKRLCINERVTGSSKLVPSLRTRSAGCGHYRNIYWSETTIWSWILSARYIISYAMSALLRNNENIMLIGDFV